MDAIVCSIHTLIACFSWSNLFIDSGVAVSDSAGYALREDLQVTYWPNPETPFETRKVDSVSTYRQNPYGLLAIGYDIDFKSVTWTLQLQHKSSLDTGRDRGFNSIELHMKWHPLR